MPPLRPWIFVAAACCVSALPAQRTWIVDVNAGPGHSFVTIGAAIAAAASGDTILVRAGVYPESDLDIDKGLSIVGIDGQVVIAIPFFDTGVLVHDLPANESFSMRGIDLTGPTLDPMLSARRCDGLVAVHDASAQRLSPLTLGFSDCSQVHVHDVFARGNRSVRITGSRVAITSSVLEGQNGSGPLVVDDSDVTLDLCAVTNGAGPFAIEPVSLVSGTLRVARSQISANAGLGGNPVAAIGTQGGTVVLDPTAQLDPAGGSAPVTGPAVVSAAELSTLSTATTRPELTLDLQSRGDASWVTLLAFPSGALPTPFGELWIHPEDHLLIDSGVLTGSRTASTRIALAPLPPGLTAVVQAVVFDGTFELTNGTALVVP